MDEGLTKGRMLTLSSDVMFVCFCFLMQSQ